MRPTLLAIDANNLTVRRYFPKPQGGFMVDKFGIDPAEARHMGHPANKAALELMHQPVRAHKNVPHKGRTA